MLTTSVANQSITFEIPGEAVRWKRAERDRRNNRTFTADEQRAYMGLVTTLARRAMRDAGLKPFLGAVLLDIRIIRSVPQSWSAKRRHQAMSGEIWPIVRPDKDNLVKIVLDAMNGEVYKDDAQVCKSFEAKVYGAEPKTIITVQTL